MTPAERRRRQDTRSARRRRGAKLARARQGRRTCPRRFGRHGICGASLETVVLPGGHTRIVCRSCERFERGLCAECPRPVAGRVRWARRCAACRLRTHRTHLRRRRRADRRRLNAERRAAYAADPALRARIRARRAAWRRAHPERVRVQKCRAALGRAIGEPRGRGAGHPCVGAPRCRTILEGRAKKCRACKVADLRAAEAALRVVQHPDRVEAVA